MAESEHKLIRTELEAILHLERVQRMKDERQGEAEEAPSIIREYKTKILLACKDRDLAEKYFQLLEQDCHKIDFVSVYAAGKESALKGEPEHDGFYRCMRELAMDSQNRSLDDELLTVFTRLTKQMPNEEAALYPWYLLEEYRKTYGAVNAKADEFFKMGYEAVPTPKTTMKE